MQHGQSSTPRGLPVPVTCKPMNMWKLSSYLLSYLQSPVEKNGKPIRHWNNLTQHTPIYGHKGVSYVVDLDTIGKGAPNQISTLFATITELVPCGKCKGSSLPPLSVSPMLHAVLAFSCHSRRITGSNTTPIEVGLDIPEPQRGALVVVSDSE